MEKISLDSIKVKTLDKISVDGGNVLHALNSSDEAYLGFGEVYFSIIKKDFIKAWKNHRKMTMNLVVPRGTVKFIFCTNKKGPYLEINSGYSDYKLITVPPNIWFGFQGVSDEDSLIMNFSNIKHIEDKVDRKDIENIPYKW